ncbi:reverse transcriptase [Caerostris darwini]|uniref:Reverse transcriptase n=1 Tax=Caerostris darwini TaxID=1538125 RepID=A0AAV4R5B9_9ARAC|nr:reverse transcriptase [Caerostris darwini]
MNSADIISRGLHADKLQENELWWSGPPFLVNNEYPGVPMRLVDGDLTSKDEDMISSELKLSTANQVCVVTHIVEPLDVINNCSSFTKLKRIVAWCKRFINNTRNPLNRTSGTLTTSELSQSLVCIVKNIQRTAFIKELQSLEKGTSIPNNSELVNLCPFIDDDRLLKVGGRLKNSNLLYNQKCPLIIPAKHNFTFIVINYYHALYFHAGAETILSLIRNRFWIVRGRNTVRKIIFNCIICKKINSKGSNQIMGQLPVARVTPTRAFNRFMNTFTRKMPQQMREMLKLLCLNSTTRRRLQVVPDNAQINAKDYDMQDTKLLHP